MSELLKRSDIDQILLGIERSTFEARGTPSTQAVPAFQLIADTGFNLGRDKGHNKSMAEAMSAFASSEGIDSEAVVPEKGLAGTNLIPDNTVPFSNELLCVEYTWRKGEFLDSRNRSTVASYILSKLKDYAIALGWIQA